MLVKRCGTVILCLLSSVCSTVCMLMKCEKWTDQRHEHVDHCTFHISLLSLQFTIFIQLCQLIHSQKKLLHALHAYVSSLENVFYTKIRACQLSHLGCPCKHLFPVLCCCCVQEIMVFFCLLISNKLSIFCYSTAVKNKAIKCFIDPPPLPCLSASQCMASRWTT